VREVGNGRFVFPGQPWTKKFARPHLRKVKQVLCGGGTGHKEKVKEEDVTEGFCIYAL
jgi:hypothetical protein